MNARERDDNQPRFSKALEEETRFGVGVTFRRRRHHAVLDEGWALQIKYYL